MKCFVVMDFDGTITVDEVSVALLRAFAEGDWREPGRLLDAGEITLEQCMQRQFAMIKRPRDELVRFVQETTRVRPAFEEFLSFCDEKGVPVAVCSAGIDLYVHAVLAPLDVPSLPVVVGKATFGSDGIQVRFPEAMDGLDFKASFVKRKRNEGYRVLYVGDGVSDEDAARHADFVFARDRLLAFCQRLGLPHLPFDDFRDVRNGLERLISQSRQS